MSMVAGFLAKGGRSGPRPQALSAQGMLKRGEWLLTIWAATWTIGHAAPLTEGSAGCKRKTTYQWAIWAAAAELNRLTRLRKYQRARRDQPIPAELTTPKVGKKK